MFKKLRNRFIAITLGITTAILIIVFSVIYMVSVQTAGGRPMPQAPPEFEPGVTDTMHSRIGDDRQAGLRDLLTTLIITGLIVEILAAIIAYLFAEKAIAPIKQAYETQKTFIANASHEIKTPLAAIQANLEAADIKNNHWIDNVAYEANQLTSLNNQLLALARTDAASTPIKLQNVNLETRLQKIIDSKQPQLTAKDIKLTFYAEDAKSIRINWADFSQIFTILLDNAIKYSKKKITVRLSGHSLSIANDGAKIKKSDLPHIFERFYQSDKSKDGVGLGLAIAKSLADHNHWQIGVKSGAQTSFVVEF